MTLREMVPWRWGGLHRWEADERPRDTFRREIDSLHREMDRLIDEFWQGPLASPLSAFSGRLTPQLDESEDEKAYHVRIELPGMDKEDVDVSLSDGMLTVRGEKKEEEEEKGKDFYRRERHFGSFRRTIPIPGEVDETKIDASFKKGVLSIDLPKSAEAQKKVKHINVKAA